jgi:hypothetical protein
MLERNPYGTFDIRNGIPDGGLHVQKLPWDPEILNAANVIFGEALIDYVCHGRQWRPVCSGWVIEDTWEIKIASATNIIANILDKHKAEELWHSEELHIEAKRSKLRRLENARKGARTKCENRILKRTAYGQLLLNLRNAQKWSDQAKRRAANGVHFMEYFDGSRYRQSNYRKSRNAREKDYQKKAVCVFDACDAADISGVNYGWEQVAEDSYTRWIVYYDLPTGQASFHCTERGPGPEYDIKWDKQQGVTSERINLAITQYLNMCRQELVACDSLSSKTG